MQVRIDCLGDMCPVPVIKAKKELKKINAGDSLLIVTDHSCVARSLVEKLQQGDYEIDENEVMNGIWEITVTKK